MTTLLIIAVTVVVSIVGFGNPRVFDRLKFCVYDVLERRQWERLVISELSWVAACCRCSCTGDSPITRPSGHPAG